MPKGSAFSWLGRGRRLVTKPFVRSVVTLLAGLLNSPYQAVVSDGFLIVVVVVQTFLTRRRNV